MLMDVVLKVIDRTAVSQVDVFHHPEFFKRIQRPIYRRQVYVRALTMDNREDLLGRDVAGCLNDGRYDSTSRRSYAAALVVDSLNGLQQNTRLLARRVVQLRYGFLLLDSNR